MANNIVEIDLNKLDADIAETQKQLELLISTRKYAQSIAIKADQVLVNKEETQTKTVSSPAKKSSSKASLGVTKFILSFLRGNDKVDSNTIIKAYATYLKKTEKQVAGNVANALSRLKSSHKVNNAPTPEGKKKGTHWFLLKSL